MLTRSARHVLATIAAVCLLLTATARAEIKLYVAPDGRPGASGLAPTPTADGQDGPLASPTAARDAIRARRAKGEWVGEPITVTLAPGTYFLPEPLELGPQDGGKENAPVTYQAAEPGKVILSGGQRITLDAPPQTQLADRSAIGSALQNGGVSRVTGWKPATLNGRSVWAAQIPDVREGKWYFRQLFVNGRRAPRPRLPKEGYFTFAGLPTTRPDTTWGEGQDQASFKPGEIRNWNNLPDVEITALSLWIESHLPIAAVDETARLVKFTKKSVFRLTNTHAPGDFSRYYVENVMEALDTPGQWYLDRASGTLYYYPRSGETPESTEIIAPRLPHLLAIAGKPDGSQPVFDIHVKGLTFSHADWSLPADTAGWSQAAAGAPGAVQLSRAGRCLIENCTVSHVSAYGIEIQAGCQGNTISNCTVTDTGAGGVKLGHDSASTTLTNCEIGPGGHIFHAGVGVWIGNSGSNTVTHNHIHHFYYTGVSVGWAWGYGASKATYNKVEYNHIHDIGQGMLADMGGIYTLGPSPGSTLRYNHIHDVAGHGYGGWGIYNDEGSTGYLIENNVVYRTTHGGYHQHYGQHNLIRNNVFAFANPKVGQIIRSREEDHISFFFEHNIVYFEGGPLLGSTWKNGNWRLDYNCYWDLTGNELKPAGMTWPEWQAKGNDTHSIIADPLFADAKNGDFTLKPDSPALKVGFKPIDTSQIGIQKK